MADASSPSAEAANWSAGIWADGKEIWSLNVLKATGGQNLGWGTASTPLVTEKLVYVQAGVGADAPVVVAVDRTSGKIAWQSEARGRQNRPANAQGAGYAHPILADPGAPGPQLIVLGSDQVYAMDPQTGKTIWAQPWVTQTEVNSSTPIYRDGQLFLTSAYGTGSALFALSPTGAQKAWENKKAQSRFQGAILADDKLYLNSEGTILCLDWKTGQIKWTEKDSGLRLGFGGSLVKAGDKFILLSERGKLTLARLKDGGLERISQTQLIDGREIWATPLIYDGKLYVKGPADLVCVDIGDGRGK